MQQLPHWATCNTQSFPLAWTTAEVIGGFEKWENACHQCAELWYSKWQNGSLTSLDYIDIRIHHETLASPLVLKIRDGTRIDAIRHTITSTLGQTNSKEVLLIEILENPTTDVGTEPRDENQPRAVGARLLSTKDKIIRHTAQEPRSIDIIVTYAIPVTQLPPLNTSNPWTMIFLTPPTANTMNWRTIGINQATCTTNVLHTILDNDLSTTYTQTQHYQIRATNTSDGLGRVLSDSRPITQQGLRGGEIITAEAISMPIQELDVMQERDITWGGERHMSTQDSAIPPTPNTSNNRACREDHLGQQQDGGHADTCAHVPPKDVQSKLPRNPTHGDSDRWPLAIQSLTGNKWPPKIQSLTGSKWHVWVHNATTIRAIKDAMCRTTPNLSPDNIDIAMANVRPGAKLTDGFKLMADSTEARDFDLTYQNTMIMLFRPRGASRGSNSETPASIDPTMNPVTNLFETTGLVEYEIEEDTQQVTNQKLETQRRHKRTKEQTRKQDQKQRKRQKKQEELERSKAQNTEEEVEPLKNWFEEELERSKAQNTEEEVEPLKNWFEEELARSTAQNIEGEIQPPPEPRQEHQAAGTGTSEPKHQQSDKHETLDIALLVAANASKSQTHEPQLPDWDLPRPTTEEDPDRGRNTRTRATELDSEDQIKQEQQLHGDSELWPLTVQSLTGHKWIVMVHNKTTTKQIKAIMCQTIPNLPPGNLAITNIRQGAKMTLDSTILADSIETRDFDLTFRNTLFVLFRLRGGGKGDGSEVTLEREMMLFIGT